MAMMRYTTLQHFLLYLALLFGYLLLFDVIILHTPWSNSFRSYLPDWQLSFAIPVPDIRQPGS